MLGSKTLKVGALGLGLSIISAGGCANLAVKRDLSTTKPGVVVYDDMCGLQDYFDGMKDSTIATPREVFGQDLSSDENGQAVGGRARFRYDSEFQLHHLRKLLTANWASVPEEVQKADSVELEVRWSKRAGVKRVVTEESAVVAAGGKSWDLPYQVCLSDFVYGEDLYNTRRVVLQLPAPPRSPFSKKVAEKAAAKAAEKAAEPSTLAMVPPSAAPVASTATPAAATMTPPAAAIEVAPPAPAPVIAPAPTAVTPPSTN
jgi:hypothetical protein